MNKNLKDNKRIIRAYLQKAWSTDDIIRALERELLPYYSCQCLVGFPTCQAEASGYGIYCEDDHYLRQHKLNVASPDHSLALAEGAYLGLGWMADSFPDKVRIKLLRPMLKTELRRRMRLAIDTVPKAALVLEDVP